MSIGNYDRNFYDEQMNGSYKSACRIVPIVKELFEINSVIDIGCGVGTFLRCFKENGVFDITGIDGDYVPRDKLMIEEERFISHDLNVLAKVNRRFDLVVSLEVAEHLYENKSDSFIDMLCLHGDTILFSAATPYQGGEHHVNEQWPEYWYEKFMKRGYRAFDIIRPEIWNDNDVQYWYSQNCIIYANQNGIMKSKKLQDISAATHPKAPASLVHPKQFIASASTLKNFNETLENIARSGKPFRAEISKEGEILLHFLKN
ncbi:class I SAM-dependent methyltransferase [Azospirillum sp. TSA6c]|uniref:class I SAM-dependent methyltransferase n=1 Tax=Azospirillum sp. TSA6c TaxID=709813 RepID=UPI000D64DAD5|nr:class I SAM-dependent methyltransferase [Azospirillum sp. TSA6c]